jgi:hypothetical protein
MGSKTPQPAPSTDPVYRDRPTSPPPPRVHADPRDHYARVGLRIDYQVLLDACRELVNAPRSEHMAARLNYDEAKAYEKIKTLVKAAISE